MIVYIFADESTGGGLMAARASDHVPDADRALVDERITGLLAARSAATTPIAEFLEAQFDSGLASVDFPVGTGGLGVSASLQRDVSVRLYDAGAPSGYLRNPIGVGHAAPTIVQHGTVEQQERFLRPMFAQREIWCQLFSEPGAGSDLAGLSTRAVPDGDSWTVTGQKVWTSLAHVSRWAMLLARTDPDVPKHRGLTYFIADMTAPGVVVRPLRQLTGDAEFSEVFLDDVVIPDAHRVGAVGDGWRVAVTTLMNERVAMSGRMPARGSGLVGQAVRLWHRSTVRDDVLRDRLAASYIRAEAHRLTSLRAEVGRAEPGPEGAIGKLQTTENAMTIYDLILDLMGADGAIFDGYGEPGADLGVGVMADGGGLNAAGAFTEDYEMVPADRRELTIADLKYGYLRSRANGIEAGSSEIMRTVLAERMLGLPREARPDKDRPWSQVLKGGRGS